MKTISAFLYYFPDNRRFKCIQSPDNRSSGGALCRTMGLLWFWTERWSPKSGADSSKPGITSSSGLSSVIASDGLPFALQRLLGEIVCHRPGTGWWPCYPELNAASHGQLLSGL